jgi:hypothetical protein
VSHLAVLTPRKETQKATWQNAEWAHWHRQDVFGREGVEGIFIYKLTFKPFKNILRMVQKYRGEKNIFIYF